MYRKSLDKRGEYQCFPSKVFVSQCPIFVGESFTVALISGIEKVWIRQRGVSMFSIESFCLTVPKVSVGESFTVALISGIEKVWIRRRAVSTLSVENFCLTVPKNYVGESFTNALISGSEKVYGQQGGGEYQDFPSQIFCLTVPKIFVEESLTFAVMSGTEKVWRRGGGSTNIFRRKIFVSDCRKTP